MSVGQREGHRSGGHPPLAGECHCCRHAAGAAVIGRHASGQPSQQLADRDDVGREQLRIDDRLGVAESTQHGLAVRRNEDVIGSDGTVGHAQCVKVGDDLGNGRHEVEARAQGLGHLVGHGVLAGSSEDQLGAVRLGCERDDCHHARVRAAA